MHMDYIHPADQLVMFMQRIYDRGLTTTSGGNLSIKDKDGNIWITPASIDKGTLTRRDIICVKPDGTCVGPHKPSSEFPFHESVYNMRPDIRAVLHAHPPALVAFSIARRIPNLDLIPTVRKTCDRISIAKYAVPGSKELGANIAREFENDVEIVLLENHGALTFSDSLLSAYHKMESVEFYAKLLYISKQLGGPKELSEAQVQRLYEIRRQFGMKGKHPANLCANAKNGKPSCHGCGGNCGGKCGGGEADLVAEITKRVMEQLGK